MLLSFSLQEKCACKQVQEAPLMWDVVGWYLQKMYKQIHIFDIIFMKFSGGRELRHYCGCLAKLVYLINTQAGVLLWGDFGNFWVLSKW